MPKLLIVDDDEAMRRMLKFRLSSTYEVIETGQPEQAVELVLVHKPAAILMDLTMPGLSGFELCSSLHSLSYTGRIPIFVVSGESGDRFKDHCERLGAVDYFQKPVDFTRLQNRLRQELEKQIPDRRSCVRVSMSIVVRLSGLDAGGMIFDEVTRTENVSVDGFLCQCKTTLTRDSMVDVFLPAAIEKYAGRARVVRQESPDTPSQKYGFHFKLRTREWILQPH